LKDCINSIQIWYVDICKQSVYNTNYENQQCWQLRYIASCYLAPCVTKGWNFHVTLSPITQWNKLIYSTVRLYFPLLWKYYCYAVFSLMLKLVCPPAHFNKHNVTFWKLGTNDLMMTTSWRYCFCAIML